jgi:predicted transcriptional regulator YdeE
MKMKSKKIVGIWVRTTNQEQKGMTDIQNLWDRFMDEHISSKIPNKVSESIYCIYTEYVGDHTKTYTTILGCEVSSLERIPEGMKGLIIGDGRFKKYTAKGDFNKGIIGAEWMKIWQTDLDRTYEADFEVYDEHAQNPTEVVVDIFVGVK